MGWAELSCSTHGCAGEPDGLQDRLGSAVAQAQYAKIGAGVGLVGIIGDHTKLAMVPADVHEDLACGGLGGG